MLIESHTDLLNNAPALPDLQTKVRSKLKGRAVDNHMAQKKEFSNSHDKSAFDLYCKRFAGGAGTYPLVGTPEKIVAAVVGLDMVFIGTGDLALSLEIGAADAAKHAEACAQIKPQGFALATAALRSSDSARPAS